MSCRVKLQLFWRPRTSLACFGDSAPCAEKTCRSLCRTRRLTGGRTLSTAANTGTPTIRLQQGRGLGKWLRIMPVTSSPLGLQQTVRLLSLSSLLGGEDEGAPHFKKSSVRHPLTGKLDSLPEKEEKEGDKGSSYNLPHPVWTKEELENVTITHNVPETMVDKAAYYAVQTLRLCFDLFSGYKWGKWTGTLDEKKWLTRIIYLETIAGVPVRKSGRGPGILSHVSDVRIERMVVMCGCTGPRTGKRAKVSGMIAAMTRHLKSLRYMRRDHGWIHTLLEEAENERMHLLTAMVLRNPGPIFKAAVIGTQGVFVTLFMMAYLISPRFCHRFVGYLEEEAVKTYTLCLENIDSGVLPMWTQLPAPSIAVKYWHLPDGAMMRDVILAIRADEAHHRIVNHTLSSMKPNDTNPYGPGR